MKNKIVAVIIIMFVSVLAKAQHCQALIDKCFTFIENNNMAEFDNTYPNLFTEFLKENIPQYQQALSFLEVGKYDEAIADLESLVEEGYLIDEIKDDANFVALHRLESWENLLNKIQIITNSYQNQIRLTLKDIQNKDQSIRVLYLSALKKYESSSDVPITIHNLMKKIDDSSAEIVMEIVDNYGWLGADAVGEEANQTLFLAIQHADDLIVQEKYLPLLTDAVKNGNAEPWHLAFLTDRILMNRGEKQIYGTQIIKSNNPENSYVVPLQDLDNVDVLRASIGLDSLKEYLEEEGIEWSLEKYKEDLPRIEQLYKERYEKR